MDQINTEQTTTETKPNSFWRKLFYGIGAFVFLTSVVLGFIALHLRPSFWGFVVSLAGALISAFMMLLTEPHAKKCVNFLFNFLSNKKESPKKAAPETPTSTNQEDQEYARKAKVLLAGLIVMIGVCLILLIFFKETKQDLPVMPPTDGNGASNTGQQQINKVQGNIQGNIQGNTVHGDLVNTKVQGTLINNTYSGTQNAK